MAASYAHDASRFTIALDGAKGSFAKKVSGDMGFKAAKVDIASASSKFGMKTTNLVEPGEITVELGVSHAQPWLDWANSFIDSVHLRKDIQILYGNSKNEVIGGVDAVDCLMTSFGLSALDAGGKDSFTITIKFAWTNIVAIKAGGSLDAIQETKQKKYNNNSFRVEIDPLPCAGVKKVGALTWNMKKQVVRTGKDRLGHIIPTTLELPDIELTIDSAIDDAQSQWEDFYQKVTIDGANGSEAELAGAITLLDNTNAGDLFSFEFKQYAPFELKRSDLEGNADKAKEFTTKGYFETGDVRKFG